jgi:3-(3-hydroxy-phenyl)propionate hydroxylase
LLNDGRRLDDVLRAGFALITTACPTAADEASLRRRGVVVLNPEPGDALATWLRRGHANAAVVRPDRTVARAGRDVAALCAWTTGVLRER